MVRVRKLVLAIAAASALSSGVAHALGLGQVSLQSALNQPLVAEIELLEVRDLENAEVVPRIASAEEFNKAGVDRQFFLTDLKFTPVIKPGGKSVIRVTSSKPVREPYLNFLVEVIWPNGRLLREYTLLVDPPLYTPAPVTSSPARMPAVAPSQTPVRSSTASTAPARTTAPTTSTASTAAPLQGNEYRTNSSDTLWEIAQRVPGGSVHQAMLAIQDLNPNAFIDGNINRLKSGQVLRLPDEQQLQSRSRTEAIAQVTQQNTAWREGRALASGARQIDATKRNVAGAAPAQADAGDSLRLVASDSGKSTSGSDKGNAQSKALSDKLAVTQESLDSSRRENTELKGRVDDLESQLEKLQRLIQLKDDQLAKMQADLAAQEKSAAEAKAATPAAVPADESRPAEAPVPDNGSVPKVEQGAELGAAPQQEATPDFNYSEEPAPADPQAQNEKPAEQPAVSVKPEPVTPVAPPQAQPKPVTPVVAPEAPATSFIDDLLADPLMLGVVGGGALLVLLIGLMILSRRNAMKEAELQEALAAQDEGSFDGSIGFNDNGFDSLDIGGSPSVEPEAPVSAQTADALGEADIYIAYGKFAQAAELLQNAINEEPHRADLRLKLMEVYAELDDREGFAREENELREIGGAGAQLDQLKAKYPAMVAVSTAASASMLEDFSFDNLDLDEKPQSSEPAPLAAGTDLDDSFDLSLDDLEAELDRDLQSAAPQANKDFADLSLDDLSLSNEAPAADNPGFDLDLSGPAAGTVAAEESLSDFDLELDAPVASDNGLADDEFMLSLDEDLALDAPAAQGSTDLGTDLELDAGELDMPADFDLSLAEDAPTNAAAEAEADAFLSELDEVGGELDELSADLHLPAEEVPVASAAPLAADGDDDFDFLSGTDETATKLDLARAYIDMGDTEGARDILDEVISEGSVAQQSEARDLLAGLS